MELFLWREKLNFRRNLLGNFFEFSKSSHIVLLISVICTLKNSFLRLYSSGKSVPSNEILRLLDPHENKSTLISKWEILRDFRSRFDAGGFDSDIFRFRGFGGGINGVDGKSSKKKEKIKSKRFEVTFELTGFSMAITKIQLDDQLF